MSNNKLIKVQLGLTKLSFQKMKAKSSLKLVTNTWECMSLNKFVDLKGKNKCFT